MNKGNPQLGQMIDGLTATLGSQGLSPTEALRQTCGRAAALLQQQAITLAYTDVVSGLAIVVACLVPLCFIMKRPPNHLEAPPMCKLRGVGMRERRLGQRSRKPSLSESFQCSREIGGPQHFLSPTISPCVDGS
jgi:hypothetical protein